MCRSFGLLLFGAIAVACNKSKNASPSSEAQTTQSPAQNTPSLTAEPSGPATHGDPARAWQYLKAIVAIGPRWSGSNGQARIGQYLHNKLNREQEEEDTFAADIPAGKIPMRDIITT